ncbi:MAG: hypothetical protein JW895_16660 [Thermoleophilaceae bacterium]|nr:hypothetical protein [Thermoleophilaceae bacterium]
MEQKQRNPKPAEKPAPKAKPKPPTLAQLLKQRAAATEPGKKAALSKRIREMGGEVPGQRRSLSPEAISEVRKPGMTRDQVLEALGVEVTPAARARLQYLANRELVEEFAAAE